MTYNDDMLRNIEYLREKASVSYEEAAALLERFDGNVMRALVELEHQGRVYPQAPAGREQGGPERQGAPEKAANDKVSVFLDKAFATRLVVEKKQEDGGKETVANLSAPFAAGVAVLAPWLTVASAGLAFVTGHTVRIQGAKEKKDAQ